MDECTAMVQDEVQEEVMPVSTLFQDYNDVFTPCKPFPYKEYAISWLQMIGRENKFVLVTKQSDAGGIKRRGRVKLIVNAPLPSLYPSWERCAEECAKGWRDGFVIREIVPVVTSEEDTLPVVDLASP